MGGGGGGAGEHSWPEYMMNEHAGLLNDLKTINSQSINPFTKDVSSPEVPIQNNTLAISDYGVSISTLANKYTGNNSIKSQVEQLWEDFLVNELDDTIDDLLNSISDNLSADIEATVLPRFRAGMRDINAVQSSSFVIGEAHIEAERLRTLAAVSADVHMKAKFNWQLAKIDSIYSAIISDTSIDSLIQDHRKALQHSKIENGRLSMAMRNEYHELIQAKAEGYARWPYEMRVYFSNALAGISGGVTPRSKKSTVAKALGGAMSGAAAGAMIGTAVTSTAATTAGSTAGGVVAGASSGASTGSAGGYWGAAIGAVVGIGMALLSD